MAYNAKINTDGTYRPFYGWTVICMVNDDFKFIENYIAKNETLSKYFSALPSSSYHMTIYNLWCNGKELLNHQQRVLSTRYPQEEWHRLSTEAMTIGKYFNPEHCIDGLLYQLYFEARDTWKNLKLKVKKVHYNGNTIRISVKKTDALNKMNKYRATVTNTCEREDGMGSYHITLAYKYKDIEDEVAIAREVNILNMLLQGQTITLGKPQVCSFADMTKFQPIK